MSNYKPKRISKIIEKKTNFLAKGSSTIKVGEEYFTLPIKSYGMFELLNELEEEAPTPPSKIEKVAKGSKLEEQGLSTGDTVRVFDTTDTNYLDEYREYIQDWYWKVVINALDVEWEDQEGNEITSFKDKKKILLKTGISPNHLDTMIQDIGALTSEREDRANFLSKMRQSTPQKYKTL